MVNDTTVNVRTYIRKQRLRYNFFFCFSKSKRCKKKTSPGGFRFPPGAPLKRPEKHLSLRQLRNSDAVRPAHPVGADDSVRPQAAPLFTELFGEFAASQRAGRVAGPYRTPANPYCPANFDCKADLPQQFKRSDSQIRLFRNRRRVPKRPQGDYVCS